MEPSRPAASPWRRGRIGVVASVVAATILGAGAVAAQSPSASPVPDTTAPAPVSPSTTGAVDEPGWVIARATAVPGSRMAGGRHGMGPRGMGPREGQGFGRGEGPMVGRQRIDRMIRSAITVTAVSGPRCPWPPTMAGPVMSTPPTWSSPGMVSRSRSRTSRWATPSASPRPAMPTAATRSRARGAAGPDHGHRGHGRPDRLHGHRSGRHSRDRAGRGHHAMDPRAAARPPALMDSPSAAAWPPKGSGRRMAPSTRPRSWRNEARRPCPPSPPRARRRRHPAPARHDGRSGCGRIGIAQTISPCRVARADRRCFGQLRRAGRPGVSRHRPDAGRCHPVEGPSPAASSVPSTQAPTASQMAASSEVVASMPPMAAPMG